METTNQKPITDTQKLEQKEHKHSTKENHQTSREETKRRRRRKRKKKKKTDKNCTNNQKTGNRLERSTYSSTITSNINVTNAPFKRHRVADWIKNQDSFICCLQEIYQG